MSEDASAPNAPISPPMFRHGGDLADETAVRHSAHWGFWGTLIWGAVIAGTFIGLQVMVTIVALVYRYGNNLSTSNIHDLVTDGNVLALTTLVTAIGSGGAIVGIIKLKKGAVVSEYLGLKGIHPRTISQWVGILVVLIIVSDLLTTVLGRSIVPDFVAETYSTSSSVWFFWVALVIVAPLFEETFFRGFLFKGFEAGFLGPVGTIFVTAGLWALLHVQYDAYGVATIFAMGLVFGAARHHTGSLLMPMGLHALANLVAATEAAVLS